MNKEKIKKLSAKKNQEKRTSSQKARTHVIINPASGGGKTGKRLGKILNVLEKEIGKKYSFFVTRKPLDASLSARRAINKGRELIIAIGGDGTIQETVNGFFSDGNPINPACQLGIINTGTGSGFAMSLGLPPAINDQIDAIFSGQKRFIDVGRAVFSNKNGRLKEHFFVNECQAGIGGAVVKNVQSKLKKLGGLIAFGSIALSTALRYPNQPITVEIDSTQKITKRLIGVVMANGNSMAGGMKLTPQAKIDDGLFDILLMHEQSVPQRLWNFPKIYSGGHITSSKFSFYRGKTIALASSERVLFEADGELLGYLPCKVEIIPSALQIRSNFSEKG